MKNFVVSILHCCVFTYKILFSGKANFNSVLFLYVSYQSVCFRETFFNLYFTCLFSSEHTVFNCNAPVVSFVSPAFVHCLGFVDMQFQL